MKSNQIYTLLSLIFLTVFGAKAQEMELPAYSDWGSVELNGKLYMERLPLTPSVKIYMKKSSEISVSVRAPFIGEVGRIEIAGDSILAVNKMKRIYCSESIEGLKYDYPDIVGDLQALLLGRVVVFRDGQLSHRNAPWLDITPVATDSTLNTETEAPLETERKWQLNFPKGRTDADEFGYTYLVDSQGRVEQLGMALQSAELEGGMIVDYNGDKSDMTFVLLKNDELKYMVRLALDAPRWGATGMAPLKINGKYRHVGISEFIKSF